jgi:hypothetical protein
METLSAANAKWRTADFYFLLGGVCGLWQFLKYPELVLTLLNEDRGRFDETFYNRLGCIHICMYFHKCNAVGRYSTRIFVSKSFITYICMYVASFSGALNKILKTFQNKKCGWTGVVATWLSCPPPDRWFESGNVFGICTYIHWNAIVLKIKIHV